MLNVLDLWQVHADFASRAFAHSAWSSGEMRTYSFHSMNNLEVRTDPSSGRLATPQLE